MYYHPSIQRPERPQTRAIVPYRKFMHGAVVEHKYLPGSVLIIVGGPERGLTGNLYFVFGFSFWRESVLEKNLMEV